MRACASCTQPCSTRRRACLAKTSVHAWKWSADACTQASCQALDAVLLKEHTYTQPRASVGISRYMPERWRSRCMAGGSRITPHAAHGTQDARHLYRTLPSLAVWP